VGVRYGQRCKHKRTLKRKSEDFIHASGVAPHTSDTQGGNWTEKLVNLSKFPHKSGYHSSIMGWNNPGKHEGNGKSRMKSHEFAIVMFLQYLGNRTGGLIQQTPANCYIHHSTICYQQVIIFMYSYIYIIIYVYINYIFTPNLHLRIIANKRL